MTTSAPDEAAPALAMADRVIGAVETVTNFIAALAILGLMLIGVSQILLRKFFNAPMFGYIDLVEQSIALFAFLGIAYCQRYGGHIRMEIVLGTFRGRLLWICEAIGVVLAMVVAAVVMVYSFEHFLRAWELGDTTTDIEFPVWPSKLVVPVSLALLLVRLLIQLIGYVRLFADPRRRPVAVPIVESVRQQAENEAREALAATKL